MFLSMTALNILNVIEYRAGYPVSATASSSWYHKLFWWSKVWYVINFIIQVRWSWMWKIDSSLLWYATLLWLLSLRLVLLELLIYWTGEVVCTNLVLSLISFSNRRFWSQWKRKEKYRWSEITACSQTGLDGFFHS